MRVFIAGLVTETNVYSPIPTGRRSFEEFEYRRGTATSYPPTFFSGPLHVWRREGELRGWAVIEGLVAAAQPAGLTSRQAYESLREEILSDLRTAQPVSLVLLNLHGAMIAEGYDDCEADLLAHVRALVGLKCVIGVELDLHCHLSEAKLRAADVIVLYKEHPHTDPMDRAHELFRLCAAAAEGKIRPVMAQYDCHMMGSYHTPLEPMKTFVARMMAAEGKGNILSVSLAHGFPFADVEAVGSRILVVADSDLAEAEALALQLGRELFEIRTQVAASYLTADEALAIAAAEAQGPVIIADRADNPGSGAPGDSTFLLARLLERDVGRCLIGIMWDPIAVKIAQEAGVGATLEMRLGGKCGAASGNPIDLRVAVRGLRCNAQQPFGRTVEPLGDMAWLSAGHVDVVVTTLRQQTFHPNAFRAVGIEPESYKIVVVKSAQHFYDGFVSIAKRTLYVSTPGAAQPDYMSRPYSKRKTPFWPRVADPFKIKLDVK